MPVECVFVALVSLHFANGLIILQPNASLFLLSLNGWIQQGNMLLILLWTIIPQLME